MFGLTREERKAVIFLAAVALAGCAITFLVKRFIPVRQIVFADPNLGRIDLNNADRDTLKLIPGVGDKLAQRILDYRRRNGRFIRCEELMSIKGFHNRTWEKAKDQVYIK